MNGTKDAMLIAMLLSAISVPCCRAATDDILSGRELLRADGKPAGQKPPAEGRPTGFELLDKYAQTQGKLRSFIAKGKGLYRGFASGTLTGKPTSECFMDYEARFDGRRASFRRYLWGRINPQPWGYFPEDKPIYASRLWDGETHFRYDTAGSALGSFDIHKDSLDGTRAEKTLVDEYSAAMLMGYFYPEGIRIDLRLRKADAMSVREKMENMGGSACYVIEARIKKGEYKLWIDPEHGYNIARIEIERGAGDAGGLKRFSFSLTNVHFKEVQNVWLPVRADTQSRFEYRSGNYSTGANEFEIKEIVLSPDHDALGSFVPDDIKDGAQGHIRLGNITVGDDGPSYVWSKNPRFVVDANNRLVRYDPNTMPIPVVKALPKLKQFDLDLGQDWAKEKRVLLCFWEMGQPDSEQLAATLKQRQESLPEKGVAVILVEACAATRARLKSWASRNQIAFPVGSFSERSVEALRQGWGIETLPRLVLTDRKHVITAEGFGLPELDDKIKGTDNAER
jgi:hypothetical protein